MELFSCRVHEDKNRPGVPPVVTTYSGLCASLFHGADSLLGDDHAAQGGQALRVAHNTAGVTQTNSSADH